MEANKDKETIVETIRKNRRETVPLPDPYVSNAIEPGTNRLQLFKESLALVGAVYYDLNEKEEDPESFLTGHFPNAKDFRKPEFRKAYSPSCSKEKLNQLGTAVLEGEFGVAENGAIWLDDSGFPNRLIPFIAEELIICLRSDRIVGNMHEAYSLQVPTNPDFGVFVSGPSKTADIEQTLVYGAHGPKKLTVVLSTYQF